MLLKKINAVIGLIATVLIFDHAIFNAVWMLSKGSIPKTSFMAWVLVGFMAVHAILSIETSTRQVVANTDAASYPKKNVMTIVQRVSGMLLIVFTALHIASTAGPLNPPKAIHMIMPVLFYTVTLMHVAISASKALVTLGVGNAKAIKIIDVIIKAACVAVLAFDLIGFYTFLA